jgi:hypothetical protein
MLVFSLQLILVERNILFMKYVKQQLKQALMTLVGQLLHLFFSHPTYLTANDVTKAHKCRGITANQQYLLHLLKSKVAHKQHQHLFSLAVNLPSNLVF